MLASVFAMLFATIAMSNQATPPPAAFVLDIQNGCHPVIEVGKFVGCTTALNTEDGSTLVVEDDPAFAGLKWVDGTPRWVTGT